MIKAVAVLVAVIGWANAGPVINSNLGQFSGLGKKAVVAAAVIPEELDAYPKYNYGYSVSDPFTGDHKTQFEARDGDVVQGEYSLIEPDGTLRTVTYTSDDINGFNAIVHRGVGGVAKAVVATPIVAPTVVKTAAVAATPVAKVVRAPVFSAAAPVFSAAAPVFSAATPVFTAATPVRVAKQTASSSPVYRSVKLAPVYRPSPNGGSSLKFSSSVPAPSVYRAAAGSAKNSPHKPVRYY